MKSKKIKPLTESFLDLDKIRRMRLNDEVRDELNELNNSVQRFTNRNGSIITQEMPSSESDEIFGLPDFGTSLYIFLRYSAKDKRGKIHRYRNRFACICYSDSFPVWVVDLKEFPSKPKCISTKESFHNFLKTVVNRDSFLRSLIRAKNAVENTEDTL